MRDELQDLSERVGAALQRRGLVLAVAESCTGGWIGKVITDVAGSSAWFDRGFITYTNEAKHDLLGVQPDTLEVHGAVSEATVREMARGALAHSKAQISVAVSGIAGPGGGSAQKPVGTVCFAWSRAGFDTVTATERFSGDRETVRRQSVVRALHGLLNLLDGAV